MSTEVTVSSQKSNVPVDLSAIAALREEAALEVSAKWRSVLVPEEEFLTLLLSLDAQGDKEAKAIAKRYLLLGQKINTRLADGSDWRPTRLAITSKKSTRNEKVADEFGAGVIYNTLTKSRVDTEARFFPLFYTQENKLFKDGLIPACTALDGKRGEISVELGLLRPGSVHDCGSKSCPNPGYINKEGAHDKTPKPFQKNVPQSACQWSQSLYLVDKDFTDIFVLSLRNQAIKQTLTPMTQSLGVSGLQFDATSAGAMWWKLGTVKTEIKVPNGPATSTYYSEATKSGETLSVPYARTLLRLGVYFEHEIFNKKWLTARDNKGQNASAVIENLEASGEVIDAPFDGA